eukprot:TRINITY_DN68391_c0_g1_i1.p2 TRINITY_DN68391_c0_g1~~TRINITY_DN68391_c0_g1_i1.p2  ORF type:complete len:394 (-),score=39.72 TRINITY_DN68391_c0_g1_i1:1756-2937(-)
MLSRIAPSFENPNPTTYSDLVFQSADGHNFHAHKAIVSVRCPSLIKDIAETGPIEIDAPASVLLAVLRFLYTDAYNFRTARVTLAEVNMLRQFATKLNLPRLLVLVCSTHGWVSEDTAGLNARIPRLAADLAKLRHSTELSDIELHVRDSTVNGEADTVFLCHKALLCANSDYFEKLLSGMWNQLHEENNRTIVSLEDIDIPAATLDKLLDYMYGVGKDVLQPCSGGGEHRIKELFSIMHWAGYFAMGDFSTECVQFVEQRCITEHTICSLWTLAAAEGWHELQERCRKFFVSKFHMALGMQDFARVPKELLRTALDHGEITANTQFTIDTLLKWAEKNIQQQDYTTHNPCGPSPVPDVSRDACLHAINDLLPPHTFFNRETRAAVLLRKPAQ